MLTALNLQRILLCILLILVFILLKTSPAYGQSLNECNDYGGDGCWKLINYSDYQGECDDYYDQEICWKQCQPEECGQPPVEEPTPPAPTDEPTPLDQECIYQYQFDQYGGCNQNACGKEYWSCIKSDGERVDLELDSPDGGDCNFNPQDNGDNYACPVNNNVEEPTPSTTEPPAETPPAENNCSEDWQFYSRMECKPNICGVESWFCIDQNGSEISRDFQAPEGSPCNSAPPEGLNPVCTVPENPQPSIPEETSPEESSNPTEPPSENPTESPSETPNEQPTPTEEPNQSNQNQSTARPQPPTITGIDIIDKDSGQQVNLDEVTSDTIYTLIANVSVSHESYYCRWSQNNGPDTNPTETDQDNGANCTFTGKFSDGITKLSVYAIDNFQQRSNVDSVTIDIASAIPPDNCPILGGGIACGSFESDPQFNKGSCSGSIPEARGHCGINYKDCWTGNISTTINKRRAHSIDVEARAGTPVILPGIEGKSVNWSFAGGYTVAKQDGGGFGKIFQAKLGADTWVLHLIHVNENLIPAPAGRGYQTGDKVETVAATGYTHLHLNIGKNPFPDNNSGPDSGPAWLDPESMGICTGENAQTIGSFTPEGRDLTASEQNTQQQSQQPEAAANPGQEKADGTVRVASLEPDFDFTTSPTNLQNGRVGDKTDVAVIISPKNTSGEVKCHWTIGGRNLDAITTSCYYPFLADYKDSDNGLIKIEVFISDSNRQSQSKSFTFNIDPPVIANCANSSNVSNCIRDAVSKCNQVDDKASIQNCINQVTSGLTVPGINAPLNQYMMCLLQYESNDGLTCAVDRDEKGNSFGYIGIFQYDPGTWDEGGEAVTGADSGSGSADYYWDVFNGRSRNVCWQDPGKDTPVFTQNYGQNIDKGVWNPYKQIIATANFILKGQRGKWGPSPLCDQKFK